MPSLKIGHGYDVHQLVTGRELIIGGVNIPHETGLLGHSDADVLLHAITDAIIGALGMGDIGHAFPDTNPETEGIASTQILADIYQKMVEKGYEIGNIDATILAEAPKMAPHLQEMKQNIARILQTDITNINIKATTTEKLGFVGRREGMACEAVVLISQV
ncbi:MAG: 2-C-methyl-D-erythritol 2,4-cyclodiphosphate synthase [Lactococcus raffinolactis]|jgi:2-C-methyl-D-erythritol 2,4-cyclodiphosphate synthase|uniref:2-C-methyl-D-erythritol 2,4-cyclodiphosphate synthase n=1 Tax=Pseudolactococcus raffinolactis TaxID=1366 RepID=A0A290Q9B8_9LACT|nr:2-C-methyl-D-erythritol 2,4-cyclodiphosphate synthase [Lactococcus raffinolactis]MBP6300523.1 2-C-methyl-D-erythritol 2,4-cyclodiphosphate synthase [Lactococcus sp.]ATC60971.1 2-C-methyl-D-erythritol 2,4-cyclodiphosphate synthase [Lactococcus raffinolactis]MBR2542285.1 2-C-methyl-D-erythritol 2,4-cyclodiphosphate synthase [Lactococcus sp.]MBW9297733.1 2-C-methyl-D-erythritol 2,4-cyclodiphosphate synthase [Lactococcus raffinolactis]MBW9331027.1 2-C-methyl-D-erythritol 2,4-cyclodiphosphate sy